MGREPLGVGNYVPAGDAMTPDDIEAAARRVYERVIPVRESPLKIFSWEDIGPNYRNHCRRIATAALNVEEKE
jgi:hypothetical protein